MSERDDLHANPEARDLNGVTLFEGLKALEAHERSEGRICNANVIARAFGTLQATAHPNNDTLNNLGAFNRKTKIDKHTSTNWGYLRRMIDNLDAAGQSDVADVLIWQVWWRVNTEARTAEYRRLDASHRAEIERDYHLICQEERRLRRLLAPENAAQIDGIPVLVRGSEGWFVLAEDGSRFSLVLGDQL